MRDADVPLTSSGRILFAATVAVLALVALAAQASCVPAYGAAFPSSDAVIAQEYTRTVRLMVTCPDGARYGGSGVRIGGDVVLTAGHVIDCAESGDAVGPGKTTIFVRASGKTYIAAAEGKADADVARLVVVGLPPMPAVRVAATHAGERVCAAFALPERGRRCGEVWPSEGTAKEAEGDAGMVVDLVAEEGNSGSAVWSRDGSLVGIVIELRFCLGTAGNGQVCTAGATPLAPRAWLARP